MTWKIEEPNHKLGEIGRQRENIWSKRDQGLRGFVLGSCNRRQNDNPKHPNLSKKNRPNNKVSR